MEVEEPLIDGGKKLLSGACPKKKPAGRMECPILYGPWSGRRSVLRRMPVICGHVGGTQKWRIGIEE